MTPILTSVMYLVIDAVKDEVLKIVGQELSGVVYNKALLDSAIKNKVGNDLSYIVDRVKEYMKDGKIDEYEAQQLAKLLQQIEV